VIAMNSTFRVVYPDATSFTCTLVPRADLSNFFVTIGAAHTPAQVQNGTTNKIRSFADLPNGWHFGAGRPPSAAMISKALGWHDKLRRVGFADTDAFPGANGEIMVTGYEGSHYVEILLETDATVSLVYERDGVEVICLDHAAPDKISETIEGIAGKIWTTLGYSIQNISTANLTNLKASPSKYTAMARQSYNTTVLEQAVSATTSEHIILTSGANLPFFGSLTKPSSLKVPA
jgi:hypothetical protein